MEVITAPSIPPVNPRLYKLNPSWKEAIFLARGVTINPINIPKAMALRYDVSVVSTLNATSLTNGARALAKDIVINISLKSTCS